jgi:3-hydroxyisobutyrate dehydrogenase/2-hydroxy-3-oxopropionate reductase
MEHRTTIVVTHKVEEQTLRDIDASWGSETSPIGIVGVGKIGAAIARRLAASGFQLVLYNRSRDKADALATEIGASVVAIPAEIARRCGLVLNVVSDWAAVQQVYSSSDGLLRASSHHSVFVELSTLGPALIDQLMDLVSATGANLIDASITGRPAEIEQGQGLVMAGGTEAIVARATPVFAALGQVRHAGQIGTGATMKLAVNLMVFATLCGLSEALVLAEQAGISREMAYDLLLASPVNSKILQLRRADFLEPEAATVKAALSLVTKDLDLIVNLAERNSTPIPQTRRTREVFVAAEKAGFGVRDATAIAEFLRKYGDEISSKRE